MSPVLGWVIVLPVLSNDRVVIGLTSPQTLQQQKDLLLRLSTWA
jgi:hypothetical protein